jgi:hypothetical protein
MDWSDTYLHRFCIHGKDYGIARPSDIGFADDGVFIESEK